MEYNSKICYKCEVIKPTSHFNKNKKRNDNLQSECKECQKEWRNNNVNYHKDYYKLTKLL